MQLAILVVQFINAQCTGKKTQNHLKFSSKSYPKDPSWLLPDGFGIVSFSFKSVTCNLDGKSTLFNLILSTISRYITQHSVYNFADRYIADIWYLKHWFLYELFFHQLIEIYIERTRTRNREINDQRSMLPYILSHCIEEEEEKGDGGAITPLVMGIRCNCENILSNIHNIWN